MNLRSFYKTFFIVISFLFTMRVSLSAQQKTIPLNRFFTQEVERVSIWDSLPVHTSSKPFLESKLNLSDITSYKKDDTLKTYYDITRILYKSNLITISGEDFRITVDPVFELSFAKDYEDKSLYGDTANLSINTRGFQIEGDLGKKFSFHTDVYETQSFFPHYQKDFVDTTGVAPGFGRVKRYKTYGYDYAMASGWLSFSPTKWINLQFGHGKQFIGNGYRSLLLSDAIFNYPYLKATFSFFDNKLQYSSTYASLETQNRLPLGEVPESLFKRKGGSFNYLSWIPHNRVEIGLFEGIIWTRYDDQKGTIPQPSGAYIPILGINTGINGFDGKQNVVAGANLRVTTTKHSYIYGQVAIDNPDNSALGYQAGFKYFDLILPRLDLQVEWNSLGSYMYASQYRYQNYVHVNQPIGHPTGAATDELIAIANYRWRRIIGQVKYNQIYHSTGREGNWKISPQANVASTENFPDHYIQQLDITAGLYINPKWNLQLLIGYCNRLDQVKDEIAGNTERRTSLIYIAFRTNLINRYNDF